MKCPNDNLEMHQVQITANLGQPLLLDQCDCCGGIWFDESELYRAKQGEAEKVDLIDTYILTAVAPLQNTVHCCPRDNAKLERFSDPNFPAGIMVERCPACNGFWLNRGEFTKFQHARQEMVRTKELTPEDIKLQEQVALILANHHADGTRDDVLGRLGMFLNKDVENPSLRFLNTGEDNADAGNTIGTVLNVVTTLLRLFAFRG